MLEILPVTGIGEVEPGADLAALVVSAAPWLADGDVLVVTSKVVSKAEGRLVEVPPSGPQRDAARDAILAAETARPVARRGHTRIVQTHHGLVMASAGIDASNVHRDRLVLLPIDPDASARALRAALRDRYGLRVAVVVTDTMGRPWRVGLTDVAIGVAGLEPLRDYRGEVDAYGNELHLTQMALADELAAAGELVKGKYDGVPVAVVRGFTHTTEADGPGARALVRGAETDLFSLGTAEARALGATDAARLTDAERFADEPVDPDVVARAVGAAFVHVTDEGVRDKLRDLVPYGAAELVVPHVPAGADALTCARAGAEVHRLRAALAAAGFATAWADVDADTIAELLPLPPATTPLGILAVGALDVR